jgi:hypothetical protein
MKFCCAMRTALLIGGMVLAGCAGGDPDQRDTKPPAGAPASPTPPASSPNLVDSDWVPDQGVHLLGSKPDGLAPGTSYLSVSTVPAYRTNFTLSLSRAVDGAHLVATDGTTTYLNEDTWFTGLILTASDGGQIKITGASALTAADVGYKDAPGGLSDEYVANPVASTEYTLVYRKQLGIKGNFGPWQDYCDDGGAAVPLFGSYDAKRAHTAAPAAISFACHNGIAFKCTMWGFPTGSVAGSDAWDRNTACTAMGNARYCGDEHSFTREMTPIWIVDQLPGIGIDDNGALLTHPGKRGEPDPWPGDPDTFYIESGWRRNGTPLCLSKLRWVSLPPNPCPKVMKDPREVPSDGHEVFFCDDMSVSDLFSLGAVLLNGSPQMDAPITRWANSAGERVSTTRAVWVDADKNHTADAATMYPFADANGNSEYTTFLGTDGMLLRNLTGTLDEATDMTLLYMQNFGGPGDHFISDTGAGRRDPSFEGYSFKLQTTIDSEEETIAGTGFHQCQWPTGDNDTHLDGSSSNCVQGRSLGFALPAP